MGKRDDKGKQKFCILTKIKESKEILFGAFSESLCKKDKADGWKGINNYALSLGILPPNKDWTYVRDVWWPNVRKVTMEKIDNSKKTGTGGGKHCQINEIDHIVLDIMGKDSSVVKGLGVEESTVLEDGIQQPSTSGLNTSHAEILLTAEEDSEQIIENENVQEKLENVLPRSSKKRKRTPSPTNSDNETIKNQKQKLQLELLKLQIYKTKLECRKLEIDMGIPISTENLQQ